MGSKDTFKERKIRTITTTDFNKENSKEYGSSRRKTNPKESLRFKGKKWKSWTYKRHIINGRSESKYISNQNEHKWANSPLRRKKAQTGYVCAVYKR